MRLLNKNTARRAAAAAVLLTMTAAMSVAAFADDTVVSGYMPPQDNMVQGDIALHTGDQMVVEDYGDARDPNYGGYASPVEDPIQGPIMLISDTSESIPVEDADSTRTVPLAAGLTMKGLLGKNVLFTARQNGQVLALAAPDNNVVLRGTIGDLRAQMTQGLGTLSLVSGKASTTLNLTLMCDGYNDSDSFVLRHIGSHTYLTINHRSRRDLLIGR